MTTDVVFYMHVTNIESCLKVWNIDNCFLATVCFLKVKSGIVAPGRPSCNSKPAAENPLSMQTLLKTQR